MSLKILERADEFAQQGAPDAAIALLQPLLHDESFRRHVIPAMAFCYEAKKDYATAAHLYLEATKLDPKHPDWPKRVIACNAEQAKAIAQAEAASAQRRKKMALSLAVFIPGVVAIVFARVMPEFLLFDVAVPVAFYGGIGLVVVGLVLLVTVLNRPLTQSVPVTDYCEIPLRACWACTLPTPAKDTRCLFCGTPGEKLENASHDQAITPDSAEAPSPSPTGDGLRIIEPCRTDDFEPVVFRSPGGDEAQTGNVPPLTATDSSQPTDSIAGVQSEVPHGWYVAMDGKPRGPLTWDEVSALVRDGDVTASTLVWRKGMAQWEPAVRVAELASFFGRHHSPFPPGLPETLAPPTMLSPSTPTRVCEWCAETISNNALKCPHCTKWRKDIGKDRVNLFASFAVSLFGFSSAAFFFLAGWNHCETYVGLGSPKYLWHETVSEKKTSPYSWLSYSYRRGGFSTEKFLSSREGQIVIMEAGIGLLCALSAAYYNTKLAWKTRKREDKKGRL